MVQSAFRRASSTSKVRGSWSVVQSIAGTGCGDSTGLLGLGAPGKKRTEGADAALSSRPTA